MCLAQARASRLSENSNNVLMEVYHTAQARVESLGRNVIPPRQVRLA